MSDKGNPLPKPPTTPFGGKKRFEGPEEKVLLMADRIAEAMTEGKLDEFLRQEIPDNEYARAMVSMMMGMTGMLPSEGVLPSAAKKQEEPERTAEEEVLPEAPSSPPPPEDIVKAVDEGDVKGLMGLLEREHMKRMPDTGEGPLEEERSSPSGRHEVEREMLDQLMKIASENSLSLDWIILRALNLYVREYQRTGRL